MAKTDTQVTDTQAQDQEVPTASRPLALTAEDVRRDQEMAMFERQHATRDRLRAKAGQVEVIATTDFTIHDDPLLEEGHVVRRGDELEISAYDLDKSYHGKVRLKELPPSPGAPAINNGVTITSG